MVEAAVFPQGLSACDILACECSRFVPASRSISARPLYQQGHLVTFLSLRGTAFAKLEGELLCGIQQKAQYFCLLSLQSTSNAILSDHWLFNGFDDGVPAPYSAHDPQTGAQTLFSLCRSCCFCRLSSKHLLRYLYPLQNLLLVGLFGDP
jgi:hypothetical protein